MPAKARILVLSWFVLAGCASEDGGGSNPWRNPAANPVDSEAPYGLLAVSDGHARLLRVDNVDGQPELLELEFELPGSPDELRFAPYETGALGEDVGLFGLGTGDAPFFADVSVFSDRDHRADLRDLPLGSRPWDVAVGELEWMGLSLRGSASVEVVPLGEPPFQVSMGPWADGDGDPDVGRLAFVGDDLVVALERRQGEDGPPAVGGGRLIRIEPDGEASPITTGDLPGLFATSGPGEPVALRTGEGADVRVFDLDLDETRAEGALRLEAADLPGELLDILVASRGELLAVVRRPETAEVYCVVPGESSPELILETDGVPVHGHLSTTGVLSVALEEGEAGRVEVLRFVDCSAEPQPVWSIPLDSRPLATAMGGALPPDLL